MAKKAAPTGTAPKAAPAPGSASGKPATKGEVYTKLAKKTGLSKKQGSTVFESLTELIGNELGKKGPGLFFVPGLPNAEGLQKACHKGQDRNQPVYQGADDL